MVQAKLALRVDQNGRGYSPFGLEFSDPKAQPKHGDTKEGFAISHDIPAGIASMSSYRRDHD